MSQKEKIQASEEKIVEREPERKVVVIELMKDKDGRVFGLGNSEEKPLSEAIALVQAGVCKSEFKPIGVVPEDWK